ncbi:hypothetical protein [Rhodoferax sp. WC2427]|uniref:hypothetical protein n=1 Tax=Rhodoferax sp. WC2427 TaxID=3234144 RepID=UPI003465142B
MAHPVHAPQAFTTTVQPRSLGDRVFAGTADPAILAARVRQAMPWWVTQVQTASTGMVRLELQRPAHGTLCHHLWRYVAWGLNNGARHICSRANALHARAADKAAAGP